MACQYVPSASPWPVGHSTTGTRKNTAITIISRERIIGNSSSILFSKMTRKEHFSSTQPLWNLLIFLSFSATFAILLPGNQPSTPTSLAGRGTGDNGGAQQNRCGGGSRPIKSLQSRFARSWPPLSGLPNQTSGMRTGDRKKGSWDKADVRH